MSHTLSFDGAACFFRTPFQAGSNNVDLAVTETLLDIVTTKQDPFAALHVADYGNCELINENLLIFCTWNLIFADTDRKLTR